TIAIPFVSFDPTDTTSYQLTWTSPDSSWIDSAHIHVNTPLLPTYAGLDDTICNSELLTLDGVLGNTTTDFYWTVVYPPGLVNGLAFSPNNTTLDPLITTNDAGTYGLVLVEVDTNHVCPDVTDTTNIIFSEEFHTVAFQDPTCFGYNDGSLTINTFGTLGAVEYSIDNGVTWNPSNIFTGLTSGIYDVISRDVAGCSFSSQITLTDPPMLTITASNDTTVCENGEASLVAFTPNGVFYNWNFTVNQGPNQSVFPTTDSTVTVHASNFANCSSDTLTIEISMYDPISISLTEDRRICPEDFFSITVTSEGGHQGYDYAWLANGAAKNWGTPLLNLNPPSETEYCVTVTDECESTPKIACATAFMYTVPTLEFDSEIIENCEPDAKIAFTLNTIDSLFHVATFNLAGESLYLTNKFTPNSRTDTMTVDYAGTYDLFIEVQSKFGCKNSQTLSQHITVDPIPNARFYITPEKATIFQPEFDMVNQSSGDGLTYVWNMKGGKPVTSIAENPRISYPYGVSGEYPIELIATSEHGCVHSVTGIAVVENEVVIYAPNSFTPDGDNNNDDWRVYIDGIDKYKYHLQVYDRWGDLVFESFDPEAVWNGTLANGSTVLNGTYVWLIEAANTVTSEVFDFRGTVNIFH
ncbi:MAG: gliding motility-associated C-terminal domain-containing protein, partial [Crocinitomicaceae bacterium]